MNPDTRSPGGDLPAQPLAGGTPTPPTNQPQETQRDAAANVIRGKIDALYGGAPATENPVVEPESPYHRTHIAHPLPEADQWKQYHSAWQQYYQKYYEQYYNQQQAPAQHYFSASSTPEPEPSPVIDETLDKDEALYELRQKLLGRVKKSAGKIRRSRHFIPIVAALAVVFIFVFLQYNRVFIATVEAYVSPGSMNAQNIVIDPTADAVVGPESRLIIPKINVDVPAIYDVGVDNASQMAAMEKGVAHFPITGANSHPGEIGNTVLAGHSSNDLFDPGDYKFIFSQLEKLAPGDTIYANYQGKRYTYVVTKTEVVKPTEVNKLIYPTDKPMMTLITCTPLGTAINRLLITAEQVSPDPNAAAAAPTGSGEEGSSSDIPGNSPTFFEKLFGA